MRFPRIFLPLAVLALAALGCSLFTGSQAIGTPETPPDAPAESAPQPEIQVTEATNPSTPEEPQAAPESSGSTATCNEPVCILDGSFLLDRPIGEEGRFTIDTASRYGTINKSTKEMYHGVQFLNSTGTPVLAAASGRVVVAGDDSQVIYGQPAGTYGSLVILEHNLPGVGATVYTLYAHLSEVSVQADQQVEAGEEIGKVGMTGSVRGSTLYFEVRVGENTYDAAANPELWFKLLPDATGATSGALAGRVLDKDGNYVAVPNITVEAVQASVQQQLKQVYLRTYGEKDARGVQPWMESFASAGLPEGSYQISFYVDSELYQRVVEVQPGMLTFVTFRVK